jgi:hypothetical protein
MEVIDRGFENERPRKGIRPDLLLTASTTLRMVDVAPQHNRSYIAVTPLL